MAWKITTIYIKNNNYEKIEGGTRDAFICRTHDCKGYLMVTTDMCVRKSHQWNNYGIDLLRSDDLINWESVTFDFRKGSAIFCDPESPDVYKEVRGCIGIPTCRRRHMAHRLHRVFLQAQALPHLPCRQVHAQLLQSHRHPGSQWSAAWLIHAPDQEGIQEIREIGDEIRCKRGYCWMTAEKAES